MHKLLSDSLSFLNDNELLIETTKLVSAERLATAAVLTAINEIEFRRLHLQRGFSSLHEFLVKHLGYSDGAAHRRIAAARLLRSIPEVEPGLRDGTINLTTAAAAQDFLVSERRNFKKEYSKDQKLNLLENLKEKSKVQCEHVFQRLSPERAQAPKSEKVKIVQNAQFSDEGSTIEVRLTIGPELQKKLERVQEIFSHQKESRSGYAALIELMATQLLKKSDPLQKPKSKAKEKWDRSEKVEAARVTKCAANVRSGVSAKATIAPANEMAPPHPKPPFNPGTLVKTAPHISVDSPKKLSKKHARYIPVGVKTQVHRRDQGRCSYVDPETQRQCAARNFLHIDHIRPLALGGETSVENCRLLCAAHNQLAAIQKLGAQVMQTHLRL